MKLEEEGEGWRGRPSTDGLDCLLHVYLCLGGNHYPGGAQAGRESGLRHGDGPAPSPSPQAARARQLGGL